MPGDMWLSDEQNKLKWGIVVEVEKLGYAPEIFFDPSGRTGLAAGKAWSAVDANRVMRKCIGAVIIGMPRWAFETDEGMRKLPTEYCHYEGAMAYTLGLPMLVFVQKDVQRRVVFDFNFKGYVGEIPVVTDPGWFDTKAFKVPFGHWKEEMEQRKDVFLGYCSGSTETAKKLKDYLQDDVGIKVLDWKTDFLVAGNILEQIKEAASRCAGGIFLFTSDDKLTGKGEKGKGVPRDNVVFEAGYFIHAKGKEQVLIVREAKVKIPADLGGDIYVSLEDKTDIGPIKELLSRFVNNL